MGFSMGGHGALTVGLRYAPQYRSISALAPVCSPASSRVGDFYFAAALGPDREVRTAPHRTYVWGIYGRPLYLFDRLPSCQCRVLGSPPQTWKQFDASELARRYAGPPRNFLLDTGSLEHWPVVNPNDFADAAKGNEKLSVTNRIQEGLRSRGSSSCGMSSPDTTANAVLLCRQLTNAAARLGTNTTRRVLWESAPISVPVRRKGIRTTLPLWQRLSESTWSGTCST